MIIISQELIFRRYLSNLTSEHTNEVRQAERQAINTTIQGSAADIAKMAILKMNHSILRYANKTNDGKSNVGSAVNLILHLHDELLYEVPLEGVNKYAKILKHSMETCIQLSVPLKVKLKSGTAWDNLSEIVL